MKQILSVAILIVYFCTTTGFVISMHYCMDRFDSAEVGITNKGRCTKCGMDKKDGCCRDHVKVFKVQTVHTVPKAFAGYLHTAVSVIERPQLVLTDFKEDHSKFILVSTRPPVSEQETYLRNRVFRI